MSRQRLSMIAASLILTSPLTAQWHDWTAYPMGYNVPYLQDNCTNRFYGEIDYLLWYANQEGLSYATIVDVDVPESAPTTAAISSTSRPIFIEKDLFFSNQWRSGVRATLGFKPKERSWDASLTYTYFSTRVKPRGLFEALDTTEVGGFGGSIIEGSQIFNDFLPNSLNSLETTGVVDSSTLARWRLCYNQLDLRFAKDFFVSCDMTFKPFFGLRSLWSNQHYESEIVEGLSPLFTGFFRTLDFQARNKFASIGVNAGFETAYTLGWGLDLYGNLGGSVLWGRFDVNQSVDFLVSRNAINEETTTITSSHSHCTSVLNLDVGIGLRWNYWLNCGHLITAKFAWEQHLYTNMNQFQNFDEGSSRASGTNLSRSIVLDHNIERGDLSLSGFIFGVEYTY